MATNGPDFDGTLSMFKTAPRDPDQQQLEYMRYLVRTGKLKGDTAPIEKSQEQRNG